jgi:hypothetical protein
MWVNIIAENFLCLCSDLNWIHLFLTISDICNVINKMASLLALIAVKLCIVSTGSFHHHSQNFIILFPTLTTLSVWFHVDSVICQNSSINILLCMYKGRALMAPAPRPTVVYTFC